MEHPGFFDRAGPFSLAEVARATGAELASGADGSQSITDVRPLAVAGPSHLTFVDNRKYLAQLASCRAGACLIAPAFLARHLGFIKAARNPLGEINVPFGKRFADVMRKARF